MKKIISIVVIIFCLGEEGFAESNLLWQQVSAGDVYTQGKQQLFPQQYIVYSAATTRLEYLLNAIGFDADSKQTLELPMPNGEIRTFITWQTHIMQPELEAKYPQIKTYTAYAKDDPRVTAKLDMSPRGFHVIVYDGARTYFIDPYSNVSDGYYLCYYKSDYKTKDRSMFCAVDDAARKVTRQNEHSVSNARLTNGTLLRRYRLALACTGEYAQAVAGTSLTKANVLSAMVTSLNRVNGIYERELAITMQLVNNDDTLIFLTTGAYDNGNVFALIIQNQDTTDRRIGNGNYDIGHVFSTGGGGYSQEACVCIAGQKAQSETGSLSPIGDTYDVDYVSHEIGHEFGSSHSFNDNMLGGCASNAYYLQAYEPGSGTTIMAYPGLCAGDDIQQHCDAYFHANCLQVMYNTVTDGFVATCPVMTNTGNKPAMVPAFATSYYIPFLTPFEFTAPEAVDSVADTLNTYCWEQWDRGDFGATFYNTHNHGPIFRSFNPDTSRTRIFPTLDTILNDSLIYLGEKVPDSARVLNFKLTVRSILNGVGSINTPDDSIHLNVINTGKGFSVTGPSKGIRWLGKTKTVVTWDVSSTNLIPISCDSVNIYLSLDGGHTWPYLLLKTVNKGSAAVQVPNVHTNTARIKVKGAGNVFFSINKGNFNIDTFSNTANGVLLYPVPVSNDYPVLNVSLSNIDTYEFTVYNVVGQLMGKGTASQQFSIPVGGWASGVYYLRLHNTVTDDRITKPFVIH